LRAVKSAPPSIATIVFAGNDPIDTPALWNIGGDVPSLAATIAYLPGQIIARTCFGSADTEAQEHRD